MDIHGFDAWKETESEDWREGSPNTVHVACDTCGLDARYPVSLQGVGVFCSKACADVAVARHAARMEPKP